MQLPIKTMENTDVGMLDVSDAIFALQPRRDVLARMVRWQLAKRRQGTHFAKTRGEIRGGKKKPWRQKGTGRARQGSINAPHFRGGSKAFGPRPRSYAHDLTRRFRRLALKMALSLRCQEKKMIIWDTLALDQPKTTLLAQRLRACQIDSALIIGGDTIDDHVSKAARNLPHVDVLPRQGLNVYDIMRRETLVIIKDSVKTIEETLT
ncbi:MAG: 50S ribosomal protein L4 [Alphaproteobacteria bacterium GM202ARS2]|nr:50S ribosomal protein L4 [Alphaproteobacteria bacterium GM202ARS2]